MSDQLTRKEALAKRIKDGRLELGLTIQQFAFLVNVSKSTFRRYEIGEVVPDALTWELIEGVLGNLDYQEDHYISATKALRLKKELKRKSRSLRMIANLIFTAVLNSHDEITFNGILTNQEIKFLTDFGYKVCRRNYVYLISF